MVKLHSTIGLKLKGKHGNFIFQDVNGEQVLRQGYKEKKEPTQQQLEVRERFKLAASWAKNLSTDNKRQLRHYYKQLYPSWVPGQPSTWYNFAKTFVLSVPILELIDETNKIYSIKHPSILSIEQYNLYGILIKKLDGLSSFTPLQLTNYQKFSVSIATSLIVLTTLPGLTYEFKLENYSLPLECFNEECFEYDCFQ